MELSFPAPVQNQVPSVRDLIQLIQLSCCHQLRVTPKPLLSFAHFCPDVTKKAAKASSPSPPSPVSLFRIGTVKRRILRPVQPPLPQPARPTWLNTGHYKLLRLGASDYFYGNSLQVQKWINDNFSSWLHFENQN